MLLTLSDDHGYDDGTTFIFETVLIEDGLSSN